MNTRIWAILAIAVLALVITAQPARAQQGYVQGNVWAQISGGGTLYGDNFYVKYCTNSDGTGTCSQTQTNAYGYYSLNVPYWGWWWVFAWSDLYNWGSSTQSVAAGTVWVSSSSYSPISRPRPSSPEPIYPPDNGWHIPYNTGFYLTWQGEGDAQRDWPSQWPRTYDLWASSWFNPVQPFITGIPGNTPYLYVGADWLAPCSWYSTMIVAKMNVQVGAPGDPYYRTAGSQANWATNGPGC